VAWGRAQHLQQGDFGRLSRGPKWILTRVIVSIVACIAIFVSAGCAVIEKEKTNRGGYLDYVLDEHWLKADSKGMRALRAFAIQVSLARIASASAKNDSDRQLLAIRIGHLTDRFLPIYACAFNRNPLGVDGAQSDPCFYYDSAMVDYSTGLFDLAMIALPIDDAKRLISTVSGGLTGGAVNPLNLADLLNELVAIAKDAIKYGRIVGGLYRDTVELEVQVWLATPGIDHRRPPYRVTDLDVQPLRDIYESHNDDMPAWLAAISALRSRGLEPIAHPKFFGELGGLMRYICAQITQETNALKTCQKPLPKTMPDPVPVLAERKPVVVGTTVPVSHTFREFTTGGGSRRPVGGGRDNRAPAGVPVVEYASFFDPYNPRVDTTSYFMSVQRALCVPESEIGTVGPATKALILIFEASNRGAKKNGKLDDAEIAEIKSQGPCVPGGGRNYFEKRTYDGPNGPDAVAQLITALNATKIGADLPTGTKLDGARDKIRLVREDPAISQKLTLRLPDILADQVTRDFVLALPR
jgi:hypothetical protein